MLDPQGRLEAAIVEVGGLLGVGQKKVALRIDQLAIQGLSGADQARIHSQARVEDLQAMPGYE